jgi:hypothetical protein
MLISRKKMLDSIFSGQTVSSMFVASVFLILYFYLHYIFFYIPAFFINLSLVVRIYLVGYIFYIIDCHICRC